jgi:DEAD/DEAH box helicase domain-containing protein
VRRQFLVVFDRVPGGTGYLRDLGAGDNLRGVLIESLKAMQSCACRRDEAGREACYLCLYAYGAQRALKQISNPLAQEMVRDVLSAWGELERVETLSGVSLASRLESELEERFLRNMRAKADACEETIRQGERRWRLRFGERDWELRAQVSLGPNDGARVATRPDFVLRPVDGDPAVLPVAVYCDGFEFHARPGAEQARIADDLLKREGLIRSGSWRVWSLAWKDLDDAEADACTVERLCGDFDRGALGRLLERIGAGPVPGREVLELGSFELLRRYLAAPERAGWTAVVDAWTVCWLMRAPGIGGAAGLEARLEAEPRAFEQGPLPAGQADAETLAQWGGLAHVRVLAQARRAALPRLDFGAVRVTLRLFDEAERRAQPDFEASWRALLRAWNLLQCGSMQVLVTSSERVGTHEPQVAPVPVAEVAEPAADELDFELAAVEVRELLRAVRAAGLPSPTVGFELEDERGIIRAEAELVWPQAKVAVVLPDRDADRAALEAAGWRVVDPDLGVRELAELLGGP